MFISPRIIKSCNVVSALNPSYRSHVSLCCLPACSQAAKARMQEPISPVSSTHDADVPSNSRHSRSSANTTNPKMPARQVSPGLGKASAPNNSGKAVESAPKPKPRLIRLSAPKRVEYPMVNNEPNVGPTLDSVPKDAAPTKRVLSSPTCDAVYSASEAISTSHSPTLSKHAINEATSGGDQRPAKADHVLGRKLPEGGRVTGRAGDRQGGGGWGLGGASEYLGPQRRPAVRLREVTRALPLPPDAEVLEVRFCWSRDFR